MKLRRLPRTAAWEIDLVPIPEMRVQDVELDGMLFVVDLTDGLVRNVAPVPAGGDLRNPVLKAARTPASPFRPGRPRVVRCREALVPRIAKVVWQLGAQVETVDELPGVDAAAASLREFSAAGPLPTTRAPEAWSRLLAKTMKRRPWRGVPDSVQFRFPGGGPILGDATLIVLGNAGEQFGFVVYPTDEDLEGFYRVLSGGPRDGLPGGFTCLGAHLDPIDGLPRSRARLLREAGLVADGRYLHLFAIEDGEARDLSEAEETAVRAGVEGVLGLIENRAGGVEHLAAARIGTCLGDLDVLAIDQAGSVDPHEDAILAGVEHRFVMTTMGYDGVELPAIVLKMRKRDAVRVAENLVGVDALSLSPDGYGGLALEAWIGEGRLGSLGFYEPEPATAEFWATHRAGLLVVQAGGPKRARLRNEDIIVAARVDYLITED